MHELSIVYSIVQTVSAAVEEAGGRGVRSVRLEVGALAGVVKDALLFSYDLATEGTPLAGSKLEIVELPVVIYCSRCEATRELPGVQLFRCPVCDTPSGDIRGGRELDIVSVEYEVESSLLAVGV